MEERTPIAPSRLLIDLKNPRIPYAADSQRDAIRAIASLNNEWLINLADSIVQHGLDPSALSIVIPAPEHDFYVVLEGNRRLTALRALENPSLFDGALTPSILARLRKLSQKYLGSPIEEILCVRFGQRGDADYWIRLRHTGRNAGAGVVDWNSDQSSKFYGQSGGRAAIHTRLLDFLEARGYLTPSTRAAIPATNFRRLVETAEYRKGIGISLEKDGTLKFLIDEAAVVENLMYAVKYVCLPDTKVADIYTRPKREALAEALPRRYSDNQPAPLAPSASPSKPAVAAQAASRAARVNLTRMRRQRDRLIPSELPQLRITSPRLRRIETELRGLSLEDYRNAVSVLFRVFIELSLDVYIDEKALPAIQDQTLRAKMHQVTEHLVNANKLTKAQAVPARRACSKDSFLAPSLTLMHKYVHAVQVFPAAGDLRDHWDSLQPFIVALWS